MSQVLSVVAPVRNEEAVIEAFHQRLSAVLVATGYAFEIIYVDDGSDDRSSELISELAQHDKSVSLLELSRNFGKEVALSAGLDYARGDAVILIDADLQDPPELIQQFIDEWQSGYDVVYGQRTERVGESAVKKATAHAYYRLINFLSDVEIPRDVGDFRLLSRRAVDALNSLPERHRYMKGLFAWIGFSQKGIAYVREPRAAGTSSWSYWRLWNFALEGITSFSDAPLKMATYLGIATSTAAFLYGLFMLLRTLIWGNPVPGYPSLIIVVLFLGGVQLICLGIIGEYLARTYRESKSRPLYFCKGYHPASSLSHVSGAAPASTAEDGSLEGERG